MIIKVCGLRQSDNIRAVEATKPDWYGFIFHPQSPRYVATPPDHLPSGERIGVFVDATLEDIQARQRSFQLTGVQLYKASPQLCCTLREKGLKVIRSIPAMGDLDTATLPFLTVVDYFLFDTPSPQYGGTGLTYNWQQLQSYTHSVPFLLSGGLSLNSLPDLQHFSHPSWQGVDLNSGFELSAGLKDARLLSQFISQFRLI